MNQVNLIALICAAASLSGAALGQNYPVKPIRVIDGYPPGGGTDIVARTIAPKFLESEGQPWIVDARAGAQGIIGAEIAAKSPPDGYTLLMYTTNFTIHPSIYKSLPFDFLKAFEAVTQTSSVPMILIVHPSVPAKTVKELLAEARSKPGASTTRRAASAALRTWRVSCSIRSPR